MSKYVLAIDQGTTGTTALVVDRDLAVRGRATEEFRQIFPREGWVEHDLGDIWSSVVKAVSAALERAQATPKDLAAIGITNQRETCAFWKHDGTPIYNAIVWQDRRTADFCAELKAQGHEDAVRAKTGLVLDPYFSGTKARWLLDNVAGARQQAERGELLFGTIDTYLVYRLTGRHATDVSNASRTLLFDLRALRWDDGLLALMGVPAKVLPEVVPSSGLVATTRAGGLFPEGIPVAGIAGDQQAALFGQACFERGDAKCTYGTGAFLVANTGRDVVASRNGLLTTVAWKLGESPAVYALEGSAFIAGAAIQWLRDGLGLIASAREIEALARQVEDSGDVAFVPAFAGLGAPYWRPDARAVIGGLSRGTTKAHLARAALEGIALQNYAILRAMESDMGAALRVLKVDGGAVENDLLMQFQCDILGLDIARPLVTETTALGAAFLAGLGAGVWDNPGTIGRSWKEERRFHARMPAQERERHLAKWNRWVERA